MNLLYNVYEFARHAGRRRRMGIGDIMPSLIVTTYGVIAVMLTR
jgi:hypothetical protein